MALKSEEKVQLLILGAGWTSTFLIPLLQRSNVTFAATTTSGRDGTIPFVFMPESEDEQAYKDLPSAKTVVITFPLTGNGQSRQITKMYRKVHGDENNWIQLGSTGIFIGTHWIGQYGPYDKENPRAIAEDELMAIAHGCCLNLAGLYGGTRDPRAWVTRVATTKEAVKGKKALHLIHGEDVARAILAVHNHFTPAKRWIVNDLHVYDWWDLIASWWKEAEETATQNMGDGEAKKLHYLEWIGELMLEEEVRALPRAPETLGRVLDGRAFWKEMNMMPSMGRVNDNLSKSVSSKM